MQWQRLWRNKEGTTPQPFHALVELRTMNSNHQTSTHDPAQVVAVALEALEALDKVWGHARLGLVLVHGFFVHRALTSDELAERCLASQETVRRWIKPLINVERAEVVREGRNIRYTASRQWALHTRDLLESKLRIFTISPT
jgi:DNA-binding transcriptional ArsR family regulator